MRSPVANDVQLTKELQPSNRHIVMLAMTFFMGSMMALCVVLATLLYQEIRQEETDRLGAFSSPLILNRVPGHQGPAARLGDVVTYRGTRCAVQTTVVETATFYQPQVGRSIPGDTVTTQLMKGCGTPSLQIPMPEEVTTGPWTLRGVVRDTRSGELRYWTSEPFQVVP